MLLQLFLIDLCQNKNKLVLHCLNNILVDLINQVFATLKKLKFLLCELF